MKAWPRHPVVYEINTWAWLTDLGRKHHLAVHLGTVPDSEWDAIASQGFDAVWLMGVWGRSPGGLAISMRNEALLGDFTRALPDFSPPDNVGSAYCVQAYVVDEHLGGRKGLATARRQLAQRGLRLILDFVPNHVAPDHPWVGSHPEYFIQGSADDAQNDPASFVAVAGKVFACGRDPYFPAWADVLQLNAFAPGLRAAAIKTISEIAEQCDGIRCDMAMLLLSGVFERTWAGRAGATPAQEYWAAVIRATKGQYPEFLFIAEAYWDLEWELRQQGFDFCYDKKLYDRMEHGPAENVRQHLLADLAYQEGMVRFIENHDEPRAAVAFPNGKGHAAAAAILTLPGARLLHEGQFQGWRVRLPVFLRRRPAEPVDQDLAAFYGRLLKATNQDLFRNGNWRLCACSGWPDNQSHQHLLAWSWTRKQERALIVVNYGPAPAQGRVHLPWDDLRSRHWQLDDRIGGVVYDREGSDMQEAGLYVDLAPWQSHIFRLEALRKE